MPLLFSFSKNKNDDYPLMDITMICTMNFSSNIPPNFLLSTLMDRVPTLLSSPVYLTPTFCYSPNCDIRDQVEWYSFLDFDTIEVKVDEFTSGVDDVIDEESNAWPDPRVYIIEAQVAKSLPVSDLFDYFYKERQEPYQIGQLESKQHVHLQQFIGNNLDLFI
ncbi:21496_t:CDS:2 [Gigaspora rosea]|nr:21496_t:CDS:2 [Gigaspora rosea]